MSKRNGNGRSKSSGITKPVKIAGLIVAAIENLRDTKGSSAAKIVDYIKLSSELPLGGIKPQVKAALKRGLEFGLLKRYRGHYFLKNSDNEMLRADRIAARFAKLGKLTTHDSMGLIKTESDNVDETVSKNNKNNKNEKTKKKKKKKKKPSRTLRANRRSPINASNPRDRNRDRFRAIL